MRAFDRVLTKLRLRKPEATSLVGESVVDLIALTKDAKNKNGSPLEIIGALREENARLVAENKDLTAKAAAAESQAQRDRLKEDEEKALIARAIEAESKAEKAHKDALSAITSMGLPFGALPSASDDHASQANSSAYRRYSELTAAGRSLEAAQFYERNKDRILSGKPPFKPKK